MLGPEPVPVQSRLSISGCFAGGDVKPQLSWTIPTGAVVRVVVLWGGVVVFEQTATAWAGRRQQQGALSPWGARRTRGAE